MLRMISYVCGLLERSETFIRFLLGGKTHPAYLLKVNEDSSNHQLHVSTAAAAFEMNDCGLWQQWSMRSIIHSKSITVKHVSEPVVLKTFAYTSL